MFFPTLLEQCFHVYQKEKQREWFADLFLKLPYLLGGRYEGIGVGWRNTADATQGWKRFPPIIWGKKCSYFLLTDKRLLGWSSKIIQYKAVLFVVEIKPLFNELKCSFSWCFYPKILQQVWQGHVVSSTSRIESSDGCRRGVDLAWSVVCGARRGGTLSRAGSWWGFWR